MSRMLAKDLKRIFVEKMSELSYFKYGEGNPFLIHIGAKSYLVFLKNLSPAYFKNSPDITRVQLPYSTRFENLDDNTAPFIILGYDADNDVFVSWNPKTIKKRLNSKSNVSLYSRKGLQSSVSSSSITHGVLSNGEKILIFQRESLIDFFNNFKILFSEKNTKVDKVSNIDTINEPPAVYLSGKIHEINDRNLISFIRSLLKENKVLEAVKACSNHYKVENENMTFKDWFGLVNKYRD